MLILLGLLVFLYSVISALGFIMLPAFGEIYASSLLSLVIIFAFIFGDKILLGFMQAKLNTRQDDLNYELSNVALKFSIPRISLYVSKRVSGWHVLDNSFASPSIIINPNTVESLNKEELNSLFSLACFKIKSGEIRRKSIYLTLFSVALLPLAVCDFLDRMRLSVISILIKSILMPIILLKSSVIDNKQVEASLMEDFYKLYPLKHAVSGATFKLKQNRAYAGNLLLDLCIETISLTEQESKEKLSYYIRTT
ncbi:hypothetical protein [Halobacteriovorax sp. HLS]|uniref:hypothetical protein n=1 Tax=Halobacteriovorax sp. HLS TaxID=2234000 RepID=UPI000FD9C8D7|nr:hypothetical protein [Halobacteriovorax sp. HLS]